MSDKTKKIMAIVAIVVLIAIIAVVMLMDKTGKKNEESSSGNIQVQTSREVETGIKVKENTDNSYGELIPLTPVSQTQTQTGAQPAAN